MKASYSAMCIVLLLLLATEAQLSVRAVTCDPIELSPCLPALTGPGNPSALCCSNLKEQEPCLCQYIKDPAYKQYLDSPNAKKVSTTCGVPFPKC